MSTMAMGQAQGNSGGWFVKLLGLIFIVILGCILYSVCDHAVQKHGEGALLVDACLNIRGTHLGIWQRKSDGHLAFPCEIEPGKIGVKFDKCTGENCTSLIKEKFSKVCQIVRYLKNTGYEPADPISMKLWELYIIPTQSLCDW